MTPGAGTALRGHLRLTCSRAAGGRTFIDEQSFQAPMHLSKPYWDGTHLIVNAVNPTAGLFAGDAIEVAVRVCAGASAVFTTPSASRVFRRREGGGCAEVRQEFRVETGGWLDVCPEMLIPHGGCRFSQRTRIVVEDGGGLFFADAIAPGRVAAGEVFAFERIELRTELVAGGRLVALERHRIEGASGGPGLRAFHEHSYYASGFAVGPAFERKLDLFGDARDVVAGWSRLGPDALAFKILAPSSAALRGVVAALRSRLYAAADRPEPMLRKL